MNHGVLYPIGKTLYVRRVDYISARAEILLLNVIRLYRSLGELISPPLQVLGSFCLYVIKSYQNIFSPTEEGKVAPYDIFREEEGKGPTDRQTVRRRVEKSIAK